MSGQRQHLCPACGRDNQCDIAATGGDTVQCWCMERAMPASTALVGAPAAAAPGIACFCRDCLANEKAPALARASSSISR